MNEWINFKMMVAFLLGVMLSAMVKTWLSRAKSTVAA